MWRISRLKFMLVMGVDQGGDHGASAAEHQGSVFVAPADTLGKVKFGLF